MLKKKIEDTKVFIRSRKKKDRQYNDQKTKGKMIIHYALHRTKNRAKRIPLKTGKITAFSHVENQLTEFLFQLQKYLSYELMVR
jgi:hypothetical protein